MDAIPRLGAAVRLGALLAFAAFGLHQLRYLAAHGSESSRALAEQGHDYLAGALPYLAALLVAALVATLLRARFGDRAASPSLARRALAYAGAILLVYCSQELLEGALAAGHPAGIEALTADSGWLALPLAALFGLGAAMLVAALESLESALAVDPESNQLPIAPSVRGRARSACRLGSRLSPLAFGLARRPPPASVHAH